MQADAVDRVSMEALNWVDEEGREVRPGTTQIVAVLIEMISACGNQLQERRAKALVSTVRPLSYRRI